MRKKVRKKTGVVKDTWVILYEEDRYIRLSRARFLRQLSWLARQVSLLEAMRQDFSSEEYHAAMSDLLLRIESDSLQLAVINNLSL